MTFTRLPSFLPSLRASTTWHHCAKYLESMSSRYSSHRSSSGPSSSSVSAFLSGWDSSFDGGDANYTASPLPSRRTRTLLGSSSKGIGLVSKERKGKDKGREEEELLGGSRIKVDLAFLSDNRSSSQPEKGRMQMVGGLTTQ